jgi:hypothetical protein
VGTGKAYDYRLGYPGSSDAQYRETGTRSSTTKPRLRDGTASDNMGKNVGKNVGKKMGTTVRIRL